MAQASLKDEKNWGSKISLDCSFKGRPWAMLPKPTWPARYKEHYRQGDRMWLAQDQRPLGGEQSRPPVQCHQWADLQDVWDDHWLHERVNTTIGKCSTHCPKYNTKCRGKRDTTRCISFSPQHFLLYLGKLITFGIVQKHHIGVGAEDDEELLKGGNLRGWFNRITFFTKPVALRLIFVKKQQRSTDNSIFVF